MEKAEMPLLLSGPPRAETFHAETRFFASLILRSAWKPSGGKSKENKTKTHSLHYPTRRGFSCLCDHCPLSRPAPAPSSAPCQGEAVRPPPPSTRPLRPASTASAPAFVCAFGLHFQPKHGTNFATAGWMSRLGCPSDPARSVRHKAIRMHAWGRAGCLAVSRGPVSSTIWGKSCSLCTSRARLRVGPASAPVSQRGSGDRRVRAAWVLCSGPCHPVLLLLPYCLRLCFRLPQVYLDNFSNFG